MKLTNDELLNLFKLIVNKLDSKRITVDEVLLRSSASKIANEILLPYKEK